METLDFTFERREELLKQTYYQDGIDKGISQCRINDIRLLLDSGCSESDVKRMLKVTDDELFAAKQQIQANPQK